MRGNYLKRYKKKHERGNEEKSITNRLYDGKTEDNVVTKGLHDGKTENYVETNGQQISYTSKKIITV